MEEGILVTTKYNILSRVARWQWVCCILLLLFVIDADVSAQFRVNRDSYQPYAESLDSDTGIPAGHELCENVYHQMMACRIGTVSYADTPLRVRRSSSENRSINPYVTIITGTHVAGVGVQHLLNHNILISSRLLIALASIDIIYPFHGFW